MNTLNFNQSVGFPLETEILDEMQKAYSLFNAFGAIVGDYSIISGCVVEGSSASDGSVFINGELLEFKGGLIQANVVIVEVKTALEFEDGNSRDVIATRYVTFGTAPTQWPWADFKRGFETKGIPAALETKVSAETLAAVVGRVVELEKKNAVFQAGGGMVLWNKPANQIPSGWSEVINWRGRMPVGWNPDDVDFDGVGEVGGSKNAALVIPVSGYVPGANTSAGEAGRLIVSTGAAENGENLESLSKVNTAPLSGTVNHMNPYRVVLFIEYQE